ncbi:MAG: mandelate racemase/muconate lactonizing enzyme family protein [Dehalococcoidia bacterium]|nr:mandelate racemase/muconate lactonizing enzyme family protein [Dehalococcoidia bacterium]
MKITDVKVFRMATPVHKTAGTNWLFVRIDTDTGISGWGEGSLQYKDAALEAEILDFAKFLEGKDPLRIDWIWTSLYRRVTWTGGPVSMSAISAIDLALWDLKAKALEIPVWQLAGGMHREKVRVYANGWFEGLTEPVPGVPAETVARQASPKLHAEAALRLKDEGWTALKFYPWGGPQVITPERIRSGIELVRAVRDAVGPEMEIGLDIRARLDPMSAGRVARELEPFNIAWLEEPILYDNVEAMAEFARSVQVPVSTGEQLYNRWEFRPLLATNTIHMIQPDICHCGGFSEIRKIAAIAETHYASVAPHNSNGPISTLASLHLDMSIPNCFMQEIFVSFIDRYQEVLTYPIEITDGYARVPDGPGWGAEIDLEVLAKHPPTEFTQVDSEPYLDF